MVKLMMNSGLRNQDSGFSANLQGEALDVES
jgi:hypothetical protein